MSDEFIDDLRFMILVQMTFGIICTKILIKIIRKWLQRRYSYFCLHTLVASHDVKLTKTHLRLTSMLQPIRVEIVFFSPELRIPDILCYWDLSYAMNITEWSILNQTFQNFRYHQQFLNDCKISNTCCLLNLERCLVI